MIVTIVSLTLCSIMILMTLMTLFGGLIEFYIDEIRWKLYILSKKYVKDKLSGVDKKRKDFESDWHDRYFK